jgi:methyltransferase (TIGR00027 family)
VWARGLRIVEVDHPATLADKRRRLAAAGLDVPGNTTLAAVDFAHESLADSLRRHHVSADAPVFFSWLGVMMYLDADAIDATLRTAASFPAGSEMVLTYLPPPARWHPDATMVSSLVERVEQVGEPFVSYFEPEEIEATLRKVGFGTVEFLTPVDARNRYFSGRPADLPVPRETHILAVRR